jgi:HPr kinase/phosphorylase
VAGAAETGAVGNATGTLIDTIHATAIALGDRGALIRGPSGAGKSDLALRCLALAAGGLVREQPRLIADDYVQVTGYGDRLALTCPPSIAGLLEIRGLGVVPIRSAVAQPATAWLTLVVDLVTTNERIERLPDRATVLVHGVECMAIALHPFEASAPLKLLLALQAPGSP